VPAITEPYQAPAGHPPVEIDARSLTIEQIVEVARFRRRVALVPRAVDRIRQGRDTVQRVVDRREKVYGVTTGFGALCDKVVSGDQVKRLQRNLIISHASGVGAPFSQEVVRAMLLLRANTLASGNCGAPGMPGDREEGAGRLGDRVGHVGGTLEVRGGTSQFLAG